MQARFYLPMWGRFASPDPARDQHFEETQSWNIYSYCQNMPTIATDPDGQNMRFYFYDSNQSHSGSGHVGVAIQQGKSWVWYEASPTKTSLSLRGASGPMNPAGFRQSDGANITGSDPDALAANSINGKTYGDAAAVVELSTSSGQDAKGIEFAEQFFKDNASWDVKKANCADLAIGIANAADQNIAKPSGAATPPELKSSMDAKIASDKKAGKQPALKTVKDATLTASGPGIAFKSVIKRNTEALTKRLKEENK